MLNDKFFIHNANNRADLARRVCSLLARIFAVVTVVAGQTSPNPVLVDEFSRVPCSVLRATIDDFLQDLAAKPETVGYVVTSGDESNLVGSVIREELIKAQARYRRFDPSRLRFIRTVYEGGVRTQFWRISNSTVQMEIPNTDNSYVLKGIDKPKLLLEDANFNDSECQDLNYSEIFSRFLRDNPKSRTNIVVYARTVAEVKRIEKRTIYSLVNGFGIDRKRIRTFLKVERPDPDHPKALEYWILP